MKQNGRKHLSVVKPKPIREPDLIGAKGVAWKAQLHSAGTNSILAIWLFHVPKVHKIWEYWQLTVIHLRPVFGLPDAKLIYPEAEYELSLYAIDPDRIKVPDPDKAPWFCLTPVDFSGQFHGIDDDQIFFLCDYIARRVVNGFLIPDPRASKQWVSELQLTVGNLAATGGGKRQ